MRLPLRTLALALAAAPGVAAADPVADFYKGKQVTLFVGGGAGGGYDIYARTLAPFLTRYIPGNPGVIVQNMQGAASIRAANYVYEVAPKDGTAMGVVQREVTINKLYGQEGVRYDPLRFNWIGSLNSETSVCVSWHQSPVKSIEDAKTKELIVGASGGPNDTNKFPSLLNKLLGTQFKIVTGYVGADIDFAMERGEVAGRCGWSWGSLKAEKPDWVTGKKINVLVQLATKPLPELQGVPLVMDIAKDDEQRRILELVFAPQVMGRPFVMPPNVPQERVEAVRKAFEAAARDPELIAAMAKQRLEIDLVTGAEMTTLITKLLQTPQEVVEKALTAQKFD
jgi:tripartite-type tricarboxylate transporter receptor subunit TctC